MRRTTGRGPIRGRLVVALVAGLLIAGCTADSNGGQPFGAGDRDGDGLMDQLEVQFGSDPTSSASTIEYVGRPGVCDDGVDNDEDGSTDGADTGCIDTDGDSFPDEDDLCPVVPSGSGDKDRDGRGNECDLVVRITSVSEYLISTEPQAFTIGFNASMAGSYELRAGPDCDGRLLAEGEFDANAESSETTFIDTELSDLSPGENTIQLCATEPGGETDSDSIDVTYTPRVED